MLPYVAFFEKEGTTLRQVQSPRHPIALKDEGNAHVPDLQTPQAGLRQATHPGAAWRVCSHAPAPAGYPADLKWAAAVGGAWDEEDAEVREWGG